MSEPTAGVATVIGVFAGVAATAGWVLAQVAAPETAYPVIRDFGFPVFVCIVMMGGIAVLARWVIEKILTALNRSTEVIARLEGVVERNSEVIEQFNRHPPCFGSGGREDKDHGTREGRG